jgi:phenylacetate-CoA ligase
VPQSQLARIHASSGTKGKPTVVGYTRGDLEIWREVMARSHAAGGAEPWTEGLRRQIDALWGIHAVNFYGLSEIIGPGVATECAEERDGLHVNEDHFLPDVVDPGTGEPLPAGTEGELVLTCLTKRALPILRYRTGDVTRLDFGPCRCGRTTVRMARTKGRTDDMLVIKGVNVYPSQLEAALLTLPDLAPH